MDQIKQQNQPSPFSFSSTSGKNGTDSEQQETLRANATEAEGLVYDDFGEYSRLDDPEFVAQELGII
jgi:hypothetical protein